ncbi:MAG TPA: DUF177 domain-containing protein [Thermoanaerobaculia bacterium]|jgi:uncharacterized protein|nr:DUF177 domain-containing protein [Thermoanaerobaculia bacterium]
MSEFINFDDIDKYGPQTCGGTFEITAPELDRIEIAGVGPAVIEVKAQKGDLPGEYIVDGTAVFTADFTCARCAEPYPVANSSAFHVRFRPRPEAVSGDSEEVEITDTEELDVEYYSELRVSLRDLAIEQIQLSLPMKPLCEENCLGLCVHCGANRNRESCHCGKAAVDERWGALAGIREELAKKKDV